jgi:hypothetical protein
MKIKDIIETVDKSKENYCWPDIEDFMSELDVSSYGSADYNKFQSRVSGYWFVSWVCTDTRVGGRVYFMDDQPVAISYQEGRKCEEVFEFISVESAALAFAVASAIIGGLRVLRPLKMNVGPLMPYSPDDDSTTPASTSSPTF